jgi:galacturan 1,4-alpha-galacturonidase
VITYEKHVLLIDAFSFLSSIYIFFLSHSSVVSLTDDAQHIMKICCTFSPHKNMLMQMKNIIWLVLIVSSVLVDQTFALPKRDTCTPSSAGNSSIDDVPAISRALLACGNGGIIIIPPGKTFMIRSPLDFGDCKSCEFQIEETLKVSDDLDYWEGRTACFMLENVVGITIRSVTGSGLIDGSGQAFWDYHANHSSYQRPFLIVMKNAANITITNFRLKDSPRWFITVNDSSVNINFSELVLSAVSTSHNIPINTNGIDTADSSYITISNIHITNGDDCICFKTGSNHISVKNITCVGSRGLSVGSLGLTAGQTDEVKNVYVSDVKMIDSTPAVRIKVYPGGPSHGKVFVSNITFQRITVENCDYAFRVQTCYLSKETACQQTPSSAILSNIKLIDIIGKTSNKYDPDVANINCPPTGTCDLTFFGWNVTAPGGNSTVLCSNYDHPSGVKCTPGAFG